MPVLDNAMAEIVKRRLAVRHRPTEIQMFNEHLMRGRKERFTVTMNVTPELAAEMLTHNDGNRPITANKVSQLVGYLERGTFILTHQGLAFSKQDLLNDGQHRLNAVVKSGISAGMTVTFGCEPEEFSVVDQGKARTAADLLGIKGRTNTTTRAAVIAWLLMSTSRSKTTSSPQSILFADEEFASDELDEACTASGSLGKLMNPTASAIAIYKILSQTAHKDRMPAFLQAVKIGANLPKGDPILKLRDWLMTGPLKGKNSLTATSRRAAALIFAWNAFVRKKGGRSVELTWDKVYDLPSVD